MLPLQLVAPDRPVIDKCFSSDRCQRIIGDILVQDVMVVPNYVGTHLREAELSGGVNSIGPILCPELVERSRLPIPISIDGVSEVKEKFGCCARTAFIIVNGW